MSCRAWSWLVLIVALGTGVVLAFAPVVSTSSCVASSSGPAMCSSGGRSLVAQEGGSVLAVLTIPSLVALVPVLAPSRGTRTATAIVLTAATLVAIASVGLFLLPTVAVAWVAAVKGQEDR